VAEGLTASQAARLVGVAVTTLRTWDRRYGLGPPGHETGRHRRYDEDDLRRLVEMRRLTAQGVPPGQAAAWVLNRPAPASRRDGGGRAVAVGKAGPAVRGLTRAATRLDAEALRRLISSALLRDGVVPTWTGLLAPALIHIGHKHAATQEMIEVEHLLSVEVSRALAAVARPSGVASVLLACTDEEQHSLPVEALDAALAERGVACRLLGARVPPAALRHAVRRTVPDAVLLWAQTDQTAHVGQLTDVLAVRPPPKLVLAGGPGWGELPADVRQPATLAEAVAMISGEPVAGG
jgi:DNA-binding transcriptional MerR regulator